MHGLVGQMGNEAMLNLALAAIFCLFLVGILFGTMIGWFIGAMFGKRLLGVIGSFVGSACGFVGARWVASASFSLEISGYGGVLGPAIILGLGGGAVGCLLLSSLFPKGAGLQLPDDPLDE